MTDSPDAWIEAITPVRIARALAGFALPLTRGWDMNHLTRAIQNVANSGRDIVQLGPTRQSDRDAMRELETLAREAKTVLDGLEAPGNMAFDAVLARAAIVRLEETGIYSYDDKTYKREFVEPLRKIYDILSLAVSDIRARPRQKPRWIEKEAQVLRIHFAIELTGVFIDAFGQEPKADNWHGEYDDRPQPWPDFYRRVYGELFGETEGLNLQEVLQTAARLRAGKADARAVGSYSFLFPPRVAS